MHLFLLLVSLLFIQQDAHCYETKNIQNKLPCMQRPRPIEPQWKSDIRSRYLEGAIHEVIFTDEKRCQVKDIRYYPDGMLYQETDLFPHPDTSSPVFHGIQVTYYPNACIQAIGHYNEGKEEGTFFYYDEEQNLIEQASYKDGKLSGQRNAFYPSGAKKSEEHFVEGLLQGTCIKWYEDGQTQELVHYFQGMLHGQKPTPAIKRFYPDGTIQEELEAAFGQADGLNARFHPTGTPAYTVVYKAGKKAHREQYFDMNGNLIGDGAFIDGKPVGAHYKKHPNGKTLFSCSYTDASTLTAPICLYNEEGQKISSFSLKNNRLDGEYFEWYPNGAVKKHYLYKNGLFDGVQKAFYPSGAPAVIATYQKGVRSGPFEEWYESGQKRSAYTYKEGKKEGKCQRLYPNNQLEYEAVFNNNIPLGDETFWYENGACAMKKHYEEGVPIGTWQAFSDTGTRILEESWEKGALHGPYSSFYDDGTPKEVCQYTFGKKDGSERFYYPDGQLAYDAHYIDGKLNGDIITYYPKEEAKVPYIKTRERYKEGVLDGEQCSYFADGTKQAISVYKEGLLDGKKMLFDEMGSCIFDATYSKGNLSGCLYQKFADGFQLKQYYQNNVPHGQYVLFYPERAHYAKVKAQEATYVRGVLEGEVSEYAESGEKRASMSYKRGKKEGPAAVYAHDGSVLMTMEFHDAKQNGPMIHYFANGKIFKQVNVVNDKKEGEALTYFDTGKLAAKEHYVNDKLHGTATQWSPKGVVIFTGEYVEGKKHGAFNKYYDTGKPQSLQVYDHDTLVSKKAFDPDGMPLLKK